MKKLTPQEYKKDQELVRRIRAAGIPIIPETGSEEWLSIRQDFEAYESTVFDIAGGTGLILPLEIVPHMPVFVFSGFDIRLERWSDGLFRPLEENCRGTWPNYEFSGLSDRKFHRSESVNRFIADRKEFRRGQPVHGKLLGSCSELMPYAIFRGSLLHGSIKIFDQFENEHSATISLRVHREDIRVPKPNPLRRRLFTRPDFKAGSESGAEE